MFYVITKTGFISEILGRTRRGEKGWMRTSGIAGRYGREIHFETKNIRKYNRYEENGTQIIRKREILKQNVFLDINNLTEMSTARGEHLSFTAIRNDQKWRTWRGDRSSSNIAHSDAGRPELRDILHGMFGNMNFTRQRGNK